MLNSVQAMVGKGQSNFNLFLFTGMFSFGCLYVVYYACIFSGLLAHAHT